MNANINAVAQRLASVLSEKWWVLLLRGLVAVGFAVVVWTRPGLSLASLVLAFGIFALADGILAVFTALASRRDQDHWWILLLWGLAGVGAGILTFLAPGITAIALLFYIAVWAIVVGVLQIIAAIKLRREIEGEWLLGLAGVVSILFGVLLIANPAVGALAVLWMIAAYALVIGILFIILAFRVKGLGTYQEAVR